MRVNKAELVQILGCSLPTLNVYMQRYGDAFPVLERGGRGRDYWFDHEEVQAFLDTQKAERDAGDAERQAALQQLALPLGHNGGPAIDAATPLTPSEQLTMWKIRRLQREEAYACGRLVEASEMGETLQDVLRNWNRELHQTVRQFGREHDLDPDVVDALDKALSACQRRFVALQRTLLEGQLDESQPTSLFDTAAE